MARKTKKTAANDDHSVVAMPIKDGIRTRAPSLNAYLTRVGAEELNFRRFMIKDYRKGANYYVERALIKILPDGTLECNREEYNPTDAERKAIAEEMAKVDVPRSIDATVRNAQRQQEELDGDSFLFVRRRTGEVAMIQQKFITPAGAKVYVPWSFWSDGKWRRMEPDGPLPFWKPMKHRGITRKMIHEGAKAAAHIDDLINNPERRRELEDHPWGEELSKYEHWGMIGGALAPHRSDYAELRAETPTETVYVCDRDFPGEAALKEVSKHYEESIQGIKFGANFPLAWDMADAMPEELFAGEGRERHYVGQPLRDFKQPATWATQIITTGKKGRPRTVIRTAFAEEWLHSVQPQVYVHVDRPWRLLNEGEFNHEVRPFSDADDTARYLKTSDASKAAIIRYDPSRPSGVYEEHGRFINTHMSPSIKTVRGDASRWLRFMDHLVTDDSDRLELMRWCATLIARPDIRMTYGVLLISEAQGVGKGTLGEKILAELVGRNNTSFPSENSIVDSQFNSWMAHKRLAVIHEIYAGHSSKAYNKLKSMITDKMIRVNVKFSAEYDMENWLHFFACSNSKRAMRFSADDRRWLVPKITDKRLTRQYWADLNEWLMKRRGLSIIKGWAEKFVEEQGPVMPGATSPDSSLKREIVEDGMSQGMRTVSTVLDRIRSVLSSDEEDDVKMRERWERDGMMVREEGPTVMRGRVILLDVDLVSFINDTVYSGRQSDRMEKPLTMRKLAKEQGWHVGDQAVSTGMKTWGPRAAGGRIISNCEELAAASPTQLGGVRGEKAGGLRIRPLNLDWAKTL